MERLTEFLIELIRTLFERWGYLVVFGGTLAENMLFLGLFIPGVFILLLAGISAYSGLVDLKLVIVLAIVGTSLGDTVSYLAGRFGWRRALRRAEQLPLMGTVRTTMMRRTGLFVLAYHFLGYTRVVGPITAGAVRIPFRRWYLLDLLGATIWVTVYTVAGYFIGRLGISLDTAQGNVKRLDHIFLVLGAITVVAIILLRARAARVVRNAPATELADEEASPSAKP